MSPSKAQDASLLWMSVDAMGGDNAPAAIVEGAILGARLHGVGLLLVGQPTAIEAELRKHNTEGLSIEIVPAEDVIGMDEAATAVRKRKNASIVVAAKQVKEGKAQALIAAGSTGAAMAAALLYIGRVSGIERPAIAVTLPSQGTPCLLLDSGANADCTPEQLHQFAHMGSIFMEAVYGLKSPRVGLLNIGTEEGKGNLFVNEAFPLLQEDKTLNFIGNVEGRHIFLSGCDVAVCDGFTGNVALKSAEGVVTLFAKLLKKELTSHWLTKLSALFSKPAFMRAKKAVDHEEFGGALLLGIAGICVIAHGGSSPNAIQNAIRVAKQGHLGQVIEKVNVIDKNLNKITVVEAEESGTALV
jgi:phosphate acyltransferase